jgi:hypothetical protein
VLVSHNLAAIRRVCDRVIVLQDGEVHYDGDAGEAISLFHQLLEERHAAESTSEVAEVESFDLLDGNGVPTRSIGAGETVRLTAGLRLRQQEEELFVGVLVYDEQGSYIYGENHRFDAGERTPGALMGLEVAFPARLATGSYTARLVFAAGNGSRVTWIPKPCEFFVRGRDAVEGIADLSARFTVRDESA